MDLYDAIIAASDGLNDAAPYVPDLEAPLLQISESLQKQVKELKSIAKAATDQAEAAEEQAGAAQNQAEALERRADVAEQELKHLKSESVGNTRRSRLSLVISAIALLCALADLLWHILG